MFIRSAFRVWSVVALVLGLALISTYLYFNGIFIAHSWKYGSESILVYDPQKERCYDYSPAFPSAGGIVST